MALLSQSGLLVVLLLIVCTTGSWIRINADTAVSTDDSAQLLGPREPELTSVESPLKKVVKKRSSGGEKDTLALRQDVIAAINEGQFAVAEEKMLELGDPAAVAGIVRELASGSDSNFRVLLNLAKSVRETSLKSQIHRHFYSEVERNGHISSRRLIARVTGVTQKLEKIIVESCAFLVSVLRSNESYGEKAEVRALSAAIADWPDVSEKVMTGVVTAVFGTVNSMKILEAVSNHTDTWQALVGVDTLIEQLKETDSFKGNMVLHIASHLGKVVKRENLHTSVQRKATEVKNKIPGCLMNLFSLETFCILQKEDNAAVLLANSGGNSTETVSPSFRWKRTGTEERVSFENELGLGLGDESLNVWLAEPYEDSCFLRNLETNEYLHLRKETSQYGEIISRKGLRQMLGDRISGFVWQIESC